jgi:hypothetical protein
LTGARRSQLAHASQRDEGNGVGATMSLESQRSCALLAAPVAAVNCGLAPAHVILANSLSGFHARREACEPRATEAVRPILKATAMLRFWQYPAPIKPYSLAHLSGRQSSLSRSTSLARIRSDLSSVLRTLKTLVQNTCGAENIGRPLHTKWPSR